MGEDGPCETLCTACDNCWAELKDSGNVVTFGEDGSYTCENECKPCEDCWMTNIPPAPCDLECKPEYECHENTDFDIVDKCLMENDWDWEKCNPCKEEAVACVTCWDEEMQNNG